MKGLLITLTLIAFNANAALTDISPIGKVDLNTDVANTTTAGSGTAVATPEKPAKPATEAVAAAPATEDAATAPAAENTVAIDAKAIYQQACFACHASGVANSPKLGDAAAWAPRIATGMDALLNTALNGKGAMPPKGGNMSLSEAQIKAVVEYMVENSK